MQNYFDLYKDIWQWHKKFSKIENSDMYWQRVLAGGEEIQKKYDCQFATDLMMAVVGELEREGKEHMEGVCDKGG